MNSFTVFQRTDKGIETIAHIEGEQVTGPQADEVKKILKEGNWPALSPDRILHGAYVWAVLDDAQKQ